MTKQAPEAGKETANTHAKKPAAVRRKKTAAKTVNKTKNTATENVVEKPAELVAAAENKKGAGKIVKTKAVTGAKKGGRKERPAEPDKTVQVKTAVESASLTEPVREQAAPVEHTGFVQPETVGGEQPFGNKRKRRRRNKKGAGQGERGGAPDAGDIAQTDFKKVTARAWKMFLAEISEEGLALMDDRTAKEAAVRAFRCAEIFTGEAIRRKQARKASASAAQQRAQARGEGAVPAEQVNERAGNDSPETQVPNV